MHIKSVEFIGAIGQIGQAPPAASEGLGQVAFAGRSNVGKSSLINRLLGRTRSPIARVSQEPGKTQEINFYHVRSDLGDFALVDLPGYGYARAPESVRSRWQPLIHSYLADNAALAGVVQLIDVRHGPTADDFRSVEYLADLQVPVLFALTKLDKLRSRQKRDAAIADVTRELGVDPGQVVPSSALNGEGMETLANVIGSLLFGRGDEQGEGDGQPEEVTPPADSP